MNARATVDGKDQVWDAENQQWCAVLPTSSRNRLRRGLQSLLNTHGAEYPSDTPDDILADYLLACLDAYNATILGRP